MKRYHLYNIDFFRIVFTIIILYGHIVQHYMMPQFGQQLFFVNLMNHTSYAFGYLCDMFFIISGFFMYFSYERVENVVFLVRKKVARLWPVLAFSIFCAFILSLFGQTYFYKYDNIMVLLFLNEAFSTNIFTNNEAAWYINVMFWGYIFYYNIFGLFNDKQRSYVIFFVAFFCYSVLFSKLHLYNQPQIVGIITVKMIRGLAGMGLGCLFASFYERYFGLTTGNNRYTALYSILEVLIFYLLIKVAIIKKLDTAFPVIVICFCFLFLDFLFKRGALSRFLDKPITSLLGRYCFSIYMMQEVMFPIANKILWRNNHYGATIYPAGNIILGILLCIVLGILTYHFIEKPMNDYILNRLNKGIKK